MRISDWSSDVCSSDLLLASSCRDDIRDSLIGAFCIDHQDAGSAGQFGDGLEVFEWIERQVLEQRWIDDMSTGSEKQRVAIGLAFGDLVGAYISRSPGTIVDQDRDAQIFTKLLPDQPGDRKSVVSGKSVSVRVDPGGGRNI